MLLRKGILLAFVLTSGLLVGCTTMRGGGAPDPTYSVSTDLATLKESFKKTATVEALYAGSPSEPKRNEFLDSRVALANLAYIQFVSDLTADKQQLDAATEMLQLGLNLIGTSVAGVRAKANLAAAAAGIGGSKAIIDKEYYYEKTTSALITMMNARRKEVLARIIEGSRKSLDEYGYTQAVSDSHEYYAAGTLQTAVQTVQMEANAKEARADTALAIAGEAAVLTPNQRQDRVAATQAILRVLKDGNLVQLQLALRILGLGGLPQATIEDARGSLAGNFRSALRNRPDLAAQVRDAL